MTHNTNASDDIEIIEVTRPSEKKEDLVDLLVKWSSSLDVNKPILVSDYLYKDPLIKTMKPFQAYVYTLGLDLALNYSMQTFESISNSDNVSNFNPNLKLNIENKLEFLSNLTQNKKIIKERNPPLKLHKCNLCDFYADNLVALDHHLTQPHFYSTIFQCNFCTEFRSNSKEEYKSHLLAKHKRTCHFERPPSLYMCSKCNFESNNDYVKLIKHETLMCPFRTTDTNSNPLENLQAPARHDILDYEYLFNAKPNETNHCNQFLLETVNSYHGSSSSWLHESYQNIQSKIVEALINEKSSRSSIVSVTKPITYLNGIQYLQQLSKNNSINNIINNNKIETVKQNKDLIISIQASNHYTCHLCSMKFIGEFRLKSLIDHLRANHQIIDKLLTKTIQEYILPQIKSNKSSIQISTPPPPKIVTPIPFRAITPPAQPVNTTPNLIRILNSTPNTQKNELTLYNIEKDQISLILKQNKSDLILMYSNLNEDLVNRLAELKLISGKCFKCDFKTNEMNLVQHLANVHELDISRLVADLICLFCGNHFVNREKLVTHQLNMHKSISFLSTNKIYTISTTIDNAVSNETKQNNQLVEEQPQSNSILIDLTKIIPQPQSPTNSTKMIEISPSESKVAVVEEKTTNPLNAKTQLDKTKTEEEKEKTTSNSEELKPEFNSQHDKLIENLDKLYKNNESNNSKSINDKKENKKRKHLINIENEDETKETLKKKKIEYNCVKCSTQYTDFKEYKQHLMESHNFLKENVSVSDTLNLKILPSTSVMSEVDESNNYNNSNTPLFENNCFFCSLKFQSNEKYKIHLETNHLRKGIVKLNRVNLDKIVMIKSKSFKPMSSDQMRKSNRLSIKKEAI